MCQEQMLRADIGTHVCKQALLQENASLKAEITKLKQMVKEKDREIENLKKSQSS